MTPSQVKDVISKTKKYHTADREEGTDELGKLGKGGGRKGGEGRGAEGGREGCVGREGKGVWGVRRKGGVGSEVEVGCVGREGKGGVCGKGGEGRGGEGGGGCGCGEGGVCGVVYGGGGERKEKRVGGKGEEVKMKRM